MTVSLCIVALNEEEFLPQVLSDIEKQTYPHELMEIILVDSGSNDRTKKIMKEFQKNNKTFGDVIILDNEKRRQASGWNIAIKQSTKDVIVRVDAHAKIPLKFIEKNIKNLESGEYISGGVRSCLIIKENAWTKTLLLAENSAFGSSINSCRRSEKKQYVKTMFHAAYRKEVFEKVGLLNENLGRTEDNEFHYRIRKAGFKMYFDPDIVSYQYARSSLRNMIKQKYLNGYWIGVTFKICPGCLSLFYFVPFAFTIAIVFTLIATFFGMEWMFLFLFIVYIFVAVFMALCSAIKNGGNGCTIFLPVIFFLLHISYGIGTCVGLVARRRIFASDKL